LGYISDELEPAIWFFGLLVFGLPVLNVFFALFGTLGILDMLQRKRRK
jgi:hypothetical protein